MRPTPRTPAQSRAIHATASRLADLTGVDRQELLDAHCEAVSGQRHTSTLSLDQARRLIQRLDGEVTRFASQARPAPAPALSVVEGGGGEPAGRPVGSPRLAVAPSAATPRPHEPWGPRGPGTRGDQPITAMQRVVVAGLFRLLGWDATRQLGFVRRQCKADAPQTQADADRLIEPLKRMALSESTVPVALALTRAALAQPDDAWSAGPADRRWKREFLTAWEERLTRAATAPVGHHPALNLSGVPSVSFRALQKWIECIDAAGVSL